MSTTYKIVRMYREQCTSEEIESGLSLEDAQAHCRDSETSSSTCEEPENVERTEQYGAWFDGYEEE